MKTIPQVRKELLLMATEIRREGSYNSEEHSRKLINLVRNMYRRKAVRRASVEHVSLTTALVGKIKKYARRHPAASYSVMGNKFKVSIGRVSEALAGKRAA